MLLLCQITLREGGNLPHKKQKMAAAASSKYSNNSRVIWQESSCRHNVNLTVKQVSSIHPIIFGFQKKKRKSYCLLKNDTFIIQM